MSDVQLILRKVDSGEEISLFDGLLAGRLADSGLVLTEGHPSRQHAKFSISGNESRLEDLGSANGTFVNDQRISDAVVLRAGDKVRFDVEEYEYRVIGDATVQDNSQKTVIRKVEQLDVDIDGSDMRARPAWIDPEKQAAGGPKTEFIDSASIKEMIQLDEQQAAGDVTDDVDIPMLLFTSGSKNGARVNLRTTEERGEWTIGCDADRDVVISDQGVSGIHAKLARDGQRWKLTDQMSANGTFVNGRKSNMSYLNNGDRIRFGPVDCIFRTPESFGTATRVSSPGKPASKSRNILVAVMTFLVTLAVIYAISRFI